MWVCRYAVLDGEDMKSLFGVHFVDDGGERGGLAGAGGSGDENDAVLQVHDFFEARGELEVIEAGNLVGDYAHHDGATAALAEDVDAKTADAGEAVGKVGGAVLIELAEGMLVVAHDVLGEGFGVGGGEAFEAFVFQLDELAADFDLRGAAGREDEVADVRVGLEHCSDELRGVNDALSWLGRRRCGRCFHGPWRPCTEATSWVAGR